MLPVLKSSAFRFSVLSLSLATLTLNGCGGGGGTSAPAPIPQPPALVLPPGSDQAGAGSPTDPLTKFTTTASFTASGAQNFQSFRTLPISAPSSVRFDRTTTGFNLVFNDATSPSVVYDTRTGARSNVGTNTYNGCGGDNCVGAQGGPPRTRTEFEGGVASSLSYSSYGVWQVTEFPFGVTSVGAFALGTPTTTAQMPTTGSGTFTGRASGYAVIDTDTGVAFKGNTSLNADFAARTISGSVSGITTEVLSASRPAQSSTLGNITLSGGTLSGASFSGVATGNALAGSTIDISGATGQFGGQFYGPTAQEAVGTFRLNGTNLTVIGAFGTKR